MEFNRQRFALAAAGTIGVLYILCAILVAIAPGFALQLFGWLVHLINVDKFAGDVTITVGGFIIGLVQAIAYTYLLAWLFAWLHNRFMKLGVKPT